MKRLLRLRIRAAQSATCICDACATVTHCDASHGIAVARDDALTRSFGLQSHCDHWVDEHPNIRGSLLKVNRLRAALSGAARSTGHAVKSPAALT
jgi:hypothetical protein